MNKLEYEHLIALADLQDSLLQAYRTIFITSQSVIFSIAVFIASGPVPYLAFLLLFIGLFMIFCLWIPICKSRGYDVWFFQLCMLYYERGQMLTLNKDENCRWRFEIVNDLNVKIFENFLKWRRLNLKERERLLNEIEEGRLLTSQSKTRRKMEKHLPWSFVVSWIILAVFILIKTFLDYHLIGSILKLPIKCYTFFSPLLSALLPV